MSKFNLYNVEMEEIHHTQKKLMSPSGTPPLAEGVIKIVITAIGH
jgi:dihydrodipicolinate reductase